MDISNALRGTLLGDGARVLGRLGREVEAALAALHAAPAPAREEAEYRCADVVWRYFVQREAMGLASHDRVIEMYAIPHAVLAKVGARRPPSPAT
ncbi:MAG TPA: DUF6665 family protein [Gemmatimonadaceae bacterium]|jgi:hypothetical protein